MRKQTNKQNTSGSKNTTTAKRQKKIQVKTTERKPEKEKQTIKLNYLNS
jgi:hypothetical protein